MTLKERFETFDLPEYFSRVNTYNIIDLYIGLDEEGNKSIELRSDFTPRVVNGTSAIKVTQYDNNRYKTIRFSLIDDSISGLFYKFCEDLIEKTSTLTDENEGYNAIVVRFNQWKKLFVLSKYNHMHETAITGLIGELLFLKNELVERIGITGALKSWSGQELTHKDFSYDNTWAEIKTIKRSSQSIHISSLEQLDSEYEGELVVYALEKMSGNYNGITLNKLVIDILNMSLDNCDRDLFLSKVALHGYEYDNYYDDFVFELIYVKKYRIDVDFPKLTPFNTPENVIKASYEIDLNKITEYEIKE